MVRDDLLPARCFSIRTRTGQADLHQIRGRVFPFPGLESEYPYGTRSAHVATRDRGGHTRTPSPPVHRGEQVAAIIAQQAGSWIPAGCAQSKSSLWEITKQKEKVYAK